MLARVGQPWSVYTLGGRWGWIKAGHVALPHSSVSHSLDWPSGSFWSGKHHGCLFFALLGTEHRATPVLLTPSQAKCEENLLGYSIPLGLGRIGAGVGGKAGLAPAGLPPCQALGRPFQKEPINRWLQASTSACSQIYPPFQSEGVSRPAPPLASHLPSITFQ